MALRGQHTENTDKYRHKLGHGSCYCGGSLSYFLSNVIFSCVIYICRHFLFIQLVSVFSSCHVLNHLTEANVGCSFH